MTEYILGIGTMTLEDCEQVLKEMKQTKIDLKQAKQTIEREIARLDTIEFQTLNRKKELQKESISPPVIESKRNTGLCIGCNASNVPVSLDKNKLPKCDNCLSREG